MPNEADLVTVRVASIAGLSRHPQSPNDDRRILPRSPTSSLTRLRRPRLQEPDGPLAVIVPEQDFPVAVLSFARKYGVLGICRHGKPSGHPPGCSPNSPAHGWHGWPFYEPVAAWGRYARQLRAILAVAARLQVGRPGQNEDWDAIVGANPPTLLRPSEFPSPTASMDEYLMYKMQQANARATEADFLDGRAFAPGVDRVMVEKFAIARAAETWLRYGRVELDAIWLPDEDHARARYRVCGLSAALAVALLAALQGQLYMCAECGTASRGERSKRPPTGRRFWCDSCGRPAQKRAAARQYYRNKKADQTAGAEKAAEPDPE